MATAIKNVAIAGASGTLGSVLPDRPGRRRRSRWREAYHPVSTQLCSPQPQDLLPVYGPKVKSSLSSQLNYTMYEPNLINGGDQLFSVTALSRVTDAVTGTGLLDIETLAPCLFRAIMDPACGGKFEKTDNDLLGIKGILEEDIVEILRPLLK
ncbi:uncharacterized protein BCR38DRAFT_479074 [Pseudomassariella vexata]|uniref:NmrA-like domain-containing protein n=1 Tax=Pseudomassariella vexata TaxID=1141098 RepID=A0A1Y2D8Y0_9PEZI|nr:uncharacterized protein BCR38DRAFT_479074 [Pseudomassariella vexata]ORY55708.1 hypothetical protein BCR38DRAFT_479074 [Pseudomassariella vexata]